jgi:hypothetical protein
MLGLYIYGWFLDRVVNPIGRMIYRATYDIPEQPRHMKRLSWRDVMSRNDLVGGDIELTEKGVVYRGPIERIEIAGVGHSEIRFYRKWTAIKQNGRWLRSEEPVDQVLVIPPGLICPNLTKEGRIWFYLAPEVSITITPHNPRLAQEAPPAEIAEAVTD